MTIESKTFHALIFDEAYGRFSVGRGKGFQVSEGIFERPVESSLLPKEAAGKFFGRKIDTPSPLAYNVAPFPPVDNLAAAYISRMRRLFCRRKAGFSVPVRSN
jgi:hypothetical protein